MRGLCLCNVLEWTTLENGEKVKGERETEWERWKQAEKKLLRICSTQKRETVETVRVRQVRRRGSGVSVRDIA